MPMSPFPDDLPRRTERVLNLLAAAGVSDVSADMRDGRLEPSRAHKIFPEWGLGKELQAKLPGTVLHREVLGGGRLRDLCMGIIRDWTRTWGEIDGTFRLDPLEGLTFMSNSFDPETGPKQILLHRFKSKIARQPAVWVEWFTSDWAHHGFTDMTSWMVETWADDEMTLSDIILSGIEPDHINDELSTHATNEPERLAALEYTWDQEDAGKDVTLVGREVAPQALLIRMIESWMGRKTLISRDEWRKSAPGFFTNVESDLIRHTAACAAVRENAPSPSPS